MLFHVRCEKFRRKRERERKKKDYNSLRYNKGFNKYTNHFELFFVFN